MKEPREEKTLKTVITVVDAAIENHFMLEHGFQAEGITDAKTAEALKLFNYEVGLAIRAYLELHDVINDTITSLKMAARFPWGKTISKSDHFKLVWFQFTNLCYMYREKYLLVNNRCNRVARLTRTSSPVDHKKILKLIDKELGIHIRSRGSTIHEWYEHHKQVQNYRMIEIITKGGRQGWDDLLKYHYTDLKIMLKLDIEAALQSMEDIFLGPADAYRIYIIERMVAFERLYGQCRGSSGIQVRLAASSNIPTPKQTPNYPGGG